MFYFQGHAQLALMDASLKHYLPLQAAATGLRRVKRLAVGRVGRGILSARSSLVGKTSFLRVNVKVKVTQLCLDSLRPHGLYSS